ncbi:hypothetical protein [Kribbella deserti]|uniref:Uncharacterized protein n=1 Tax=Kribbella deserti TaxID=1926257 RepID=A0ABV6QIS0_9ACTN
MTNDFLPRRRQASLRAQLITVLGIVAVVAILAIWRPGVGELFKPSEGPKLQVTTSGTD